MHKELIKSYDKCDGEKDEQGDGTTVTNYKKLGITKTTDVNGKVTVKAEKNDKYLERALVVHGRDGHKDIIFFGPNGVVTSIKRGDDISKSALDKNWVTPQKNNNVSHSNKRPSSVGRW